MIPITEKGKKHEWKDSLNIAQKNYFPISIIHDKKERNTHAKEQTQGK
jgi:hypothetical protein